MYPNAASSQEKQTSDLPAPKCRVGIYYFENMRPALLLHRFPLLWNVKFRHSFSNIMSQLNANTLIKMAKLSL
jgi:hypothetical protein